MKSSTSLIQNIRFLPTETTVSRARELVPRKTYGIVVDEAGHALTCLYDLETYTEDWPVNATLAEMQEKWPGIITLPVAQVVDDQRVGLYLWDELAAHPDLPAIVIVDEQERPTGVISRSRLLDGAREHAHSREARVAGDNGQPSEPPMERQLVTRYGSIKMQDHVTIGLPCRLRLAINLQQTVDAQGQVELALRAKSWPLPVIAELVDLRAEDFTLNGPSYLIIEVPKDQDSEEHAFTLIPQSLGKKTLRIRFWLHSRFITDSKVTSTVVKEQSTTLGTALIEHPPIFAYAGPPPDFTICVNKIEGNKYGIQLARAEDAHTQPPPKIIIDFMSEPSAYMKVAYTKLDMLAREQGQGTPLANEVEIMGGNLFAHLFKDERLQEFYWQKLYAASMSQPSGPLSTARPHVPVVQIVSEDAYTAWEIVRPWRRPPTGAPESDPLHFCERFALTRWVSEVQGPSPDLQIRTFVVVAPPSADLKYVESEVTGLMDLATTHGLVFRRITSKRELCNLLTNGEADILHFACHGGFNMEEVESSYVNLGSEKLETGEILGSWIAWNGRSVGKPPVRPLIFFNVCDTAQQGLGLTGLDGWAVRFLQDADAGFFIGSIWKTNDELAYRFAMAFYSSLFEGIPVAEALRQARQITKQVGKTRKRPHDATYLAYSAFANPQATATVRNDHDGGSNGGN
jgi:hypothetical protein